MSLGDHLEELRRRIILGFIGPVVAALLVFIFGKQLISWICLPLLWVLHEQNLPSQLYFQSPVAAFMVYLKVGFIGGLIIGLPWVGWQLWKFIEPGLYQQERKLVYFFMPASFILSFIGVVFMLLVVLPVVLTVLVGFSQDFPAPKVSPAMDRWYGAVTSPMGMARDEDEPVGDEPATISELAPKVPILDSNPANPQAGAIWVHGPSQQLRYYDGERVVNVAEHDRRSMLGPIIMLDAYVTFVALLALAFVVAFQLPLVMYLLAKVGIVDHEQVRRTRRWAILIMMAVAAFLTPPDPFSLLLLAIPTWVLFELGLVLMRRAQPRSLREAPDLEPEE